MKFRRAVLAGSLGLSVVGAGVLAAPVQAAVNPTVDAYFEECGGDGGYIYVTISGTESNVVVELGVVGFTLPPDGYSLGPWGDGEYTVLFKHDYNSAPFFTDSVTVDCEPGVELEAVCDGPTEGIGVTLTDDSSSTYSVAIDGTFVVEGTGDTGGSNLVFGPYADGDHLVEVYWAGYEEDDPFVSLHLVKDCAGVGSGGGIPSTGGDTTPMLLLAGLLVLVGTVAMRFRPRAA